MRAVRRPAAATPPGAEPLTVELLRLALSVAAVVADAQLPTVGETLQMIGALGGTGFAVWYAYHTTTKTIPELNAMHAAAIKELNERHDAAIREQSTTHTATIRELTADFAKTVKEVQAAAREETRVDRHLYRNESHVRHLEMQALTQAIEELLAKLGHPGALQIKTPKVVVKNEPDGSDPNIDAIDDGAGRG